MKSEHVIPSFPNSGFNDYYPGNVNPSLTRITTGHLRKYQECMCEQNICLPPVFAPNFIRNSEIHFRNSSSMFLFSVLCTNLHFNHLNTHDEDEEITGRNGEPRRHGKQSSEKRSRERMKESGFSRGQC